MGIIGLCVGGLGMVCSVYDGLGGMGCIPYFSLLLILSNGGLYWSGTLFEGYILQSFSFFVIGAIIGSVYGFINNINKNK